MSTSPLSLDPIVVYNVLGNSFLDIGCGLGKWGYLLKKYRWFLGGPATVTGVDVFRPHVLSLAFERTYDSLLVASAVRLPFADKSFDSAIACDVLEHLRQDEGEILLSELKRVCRLSFVVSTPNYPCIRGGGETPDGFNDHEAHLHNFLYPEFRKLGFTQIVGIGMRSPSHRLRHLFRPFDSFGYCFPRCSRILVGFWFADGKKREIMVH